MLCTGSGIYRSIYKRRSCPDAAGSARADGDAEMGSHPHDAGNAAYQTGMDPSLRADPTDTDADKLYASYEPALLHILTRYADPKPYVVETIEKLRALGIKIGSTTGYTDIMMEIVAPQAAKAGYAPDCWFSPDSCNKKGRPYPYMIFKNMEALQIDSVSKVIKAGDTVADILEGKNAGVFTISILDGSSVIGLSEAEFEALSEDEKNALRKHAEQKYLDAGADAVVRDIRGILEYL